MKASTKVTYLARALRQLQAAERTLVRALGKPESTGEVEHPLDGVEIALHYTRRQLAIAEADATGSPDPRGLSCLIDDK